MHEDSVDYTHHKKDQLMTIIHVWIRKWNVAFLSNQKKKKKQSKIKEEFYALAPAFILPTYTIFIVNAIIPLNMNEDKMHLSGMALTKSTVCTVQSKKKKKYSCKQHTVHSILNSVIKCIWCIFIHIVLKSFCKRADKEKKN